MSTHRVQEIQEACQKLKTLPSLAGHHSADRGPHQINSGHLNDKRRFSYARRRSASCIAECTGPFLFSLFFGVLQHARRSQAPATFGGISRILG
jgi:hypothetical protein